MLQLCVVLRLACDISPRYEVVPRFIPKTLCACKHVALYQGPELEGILPWRTRWSPGVQFCLVEGKNLGTDVFYTPLNAIDAERSNVRYVARPRARSCGESVEAMRSLTRGGDDR